MKILEKIKIGNLDIQSRVIFTPTSKNRLGILRFLTIDTKKFYVKLAKARVGIAVIEMTSIKQTSPQILRLYDDLNVEDYREMIDDMHMESKIKIFIQLEEIHVSLMYNQPQNKVEYQNLIAAANLAKETGADGIELYSSNIELLNKTHLIKKLLSDLRKECGKDYPIGIRITQDIQFITNNVKQNINLLMAELSKENITYLCMSCDKSSNKEINRDMAKYIKKIALKNDSLNYVAADACL